MRLAGLGCGSLFAPGAGAPTWGQEAKPDESESAIVIYGRWPQADACTPDNTTPVSLADLLANAQTFADRCISTVGWISGDALFLASGDAAMPNSDWSAAASRRRVGP